MNYATLSKDIITLAGLPKTGSMVISAYFDLTESPFKIRGDFREWCEEQIQSLTCADQRRDFNTAVRQILSWLNHAEGRGGAVFCRAGENPIFLPMTFEAGLETRFHRQDHPVLFPLVELKDRFNRFVVVMTSGDSARLVEMDLGAQSGHLQRGVSALRERIGREWSREVDEGERRVQERQFIKEQVEIIEDLMTKRGHKALIVAGESRDVTRLLDALPDHLNSKVIDQIDSKVSDAHMPEIMNQAVRSFLRVESADAHDTVSMLMHAVRVGGLASIGTASTELALRGGRAERLVISKQLPQDEQENLVRMASLNNVPIETVQDSELLEFNGGAGCILGYRDIA